MSSQEVKQYDKGKIIARVLNPNIEVLLKLYSLQPLFISQISRKTGFSNGHCFYIIRDYKIIGLVDTYKRCGRTYVSLTTKGRKAAEVLFKLKELIKDDEGNSI